MKILDHYLIRDLLRAFRLQGESSSEKMFLKNHGLESVEQLEAMARAEAERYELASVKQAKEAKANLESARTLSDEWSSRAREDENAKHAKCSRLRVLANLIEQLQNRCAQSKSMVSESKLRLVECYCRQEDGYTLQQITADLDFLVRERFALEALTAAVERHSEEIKRTEAELEALVK